MKKPNLNFGTSKLRTKLFISYLLFIVIVAVSDLAIYKIYENNTVKNIEETSTGLVQQLSNNISYKLSSLEVGIFYATDASQIFSENDLSDYIRVKKKVEIFNMYLQSSGADVHSDLFLKFNDSSYYYSGKNQNDYVDTNIFKYVKKNRTKIVEASGKALYVAFEDEPGIVYIVKTDITIDTHKPDGIVAIGISDSYFTTLCPKSLSKGSVTVCDHDSNILICSDSVREIVKQFNKSGQESVKGQSFYNYKSDNMIIESCDSEDGRWKVLYVISLNDLLSNTESIKKIVLLLCIILLAFSLIIALVISDTLTANLRLLLKKIKLVENGHFTDKIMPKSRDETSELFNHFNIMSNKLNDLINRIAYEKSECKRAEYNALLAQINPHFLFNVLESINGIAKIKGQDDIVKIISSLSFLMRIILSENKSVVRLRDEISYVDHYISIQKVITGGRIRIEYDIEDSVLNCMVPKLIMQPIVENAINYGIEDKEDNALILISAYSDNNVLKINISDNGKGIEPSKLKSIMDGIEETDETKEDVHAHIGMKSVNRRLKILYGDEYGLKITSNQGIGTVVELSLPYHSKEKLLIR